MIKRLAARLILRHTERLAVHALAHAVAGDCNIGHRAVDRVAGRIGYPAVLPMATVWCDAIITDRPGPARPAGRRRVHLHFEDRWDGSAIDPARLHSTVVWTGQLVAARAADDPEMYASLFFALPNDWQVQREHLGALLHMAAEHVAARSS
jgi:hypothetical protein